MLSTALTQTAALWKPITIAFKWVHQVATILDNDAQLNGQNVRSTLEQLLRAMEHCKGQAGSLATAIDHFLKVTHSYAPGLFHCYDIESLPRTNNDLEQLFGSWRHHQRRCTGRARCPGFFGCKRFSANRVSHRNSNAFVYGSRLSNGFR